MILREPELATGFPDVVAAYRTRGTETRASIHGERAVIDPDSSLFAASRIVAIEAKISKWQHVLAQVSRNAWFASHSYVLLPSRSLGTRASSQARANGIGVLVLEEGRVITIEKARVRPISASLDSWIVNEWMIHELARGSGA